jgi:hypothetical protein
LILFFIASELHRQKSSPFCPVGGPATINGFIPTVQPKADREKSASARPLYSSETGLKLADILPRRMQYGGFLA